MIPYRCQFLPGQTQIMTLFDLVAVSLLNNLCEEHGFKIVVHSSWVRIMGGKETHKHCISQGLKEEYFHIDDPVTSEEYHWRYSRVAEWLSRHPEVESYVIVDDDPYQADINTYPHPEGMALRVVLVDYYDGFLCSTYNEILVKSRIGD